MAEYTKPLPVVTDLSRPYWESNRAHEFRLQKCGGCGAVRYPPKERCPECLSPEATWERVSGKGTLWSWIVMHQRYFAGFQDDVPYVVGFVQLAEGPMMMTSIVNADAGRLRCDTPVEVVFDDVTPEITLPKFRLVEP